VPFLLNLYNFYYPVIPALSRNPEIKKWIPAFAGMTLLLYTSCGLSLFIQVSINIKIMIAIVGKDKKKVKKAHKA